MWVTFGGKCVNVLHQFLVAVSLVLYWCLDPPTLIRGGSSCMAASEPALSLGATFLGVTRTYHCTGRSAGPWLRINVVVFVVFVVFVVAIV